MMALPVSGSWPTVYRPSHRPSFRLRMFPSPFARLFGMVSAPFDNEQYRNQGNKAIGKPDCYQKVIICPSEPCRLIFDYCGANLALPGTFSLVTAVRFLNGQKPFLLTTAAQNIHVLFRKLPLCRSHFFEWLKTAISSNACGMSTLKSPLLRAFFTPHVHQRLRKRPPRCTLDCGFETPESPALRGFVAERCPIRGTSLYLVLKSNGLRRPKSGLKSLTFRPNPFPRISPKSYRHNAVPNRFSSRFSTSRTNGPRSLSRVKAGTHSAFGEGSHTTAHTPKQGAFRMGALLLPSTRTARSRTSPGRVSERRTLPLWDLGWEVLSKNAESLRSSDALMRVAAPRRRGPAGLRDPCSHVDCSAGRLCCKLSSAVVR